ncbi:peptidoglycan DD-metalloendopeptidase family protein [Eubacteriales bacterium OttesenSCG-928-K08]|nr:peptidoglycan DD-metalloendopeptidase family protein [Eubacteriales bacterium OttesenSCG-928-K08]
MPHTQKQPEEDNRESNLGTFSRVLFVLLIVAACVAAVLIFKIPALPEDFAAAPLPTPEPTPTPENWLEGFVEGSYTILANEQPICTVASRPLAVSLLNWRLEQAGKDIPAGQNLIRAAFEMKMTVREAVLGENATSTLEAQNLIRENPELCPVIVTTKLSETDKLAYETKEVEDERLLEGSRLVLSSGRAGELVTEYTYTYRNGVLKGQSDAREILTQRPIDEQVAVGTYKSSQPDKEAGRSEGEKGKAAPEGFDLGHPCKADISSNFGMRRNEMHHGLDYALELKGEVLAPEAGTVCYIGKRGNYGLMMEIDHGDGFITRLAPLENTLVNVGDVVEKGQHIASLGAPVDEEAKPHLHMELLIDGIPYNPRYYM